MKNEVVSGVQIIIITFCISVIKETEIKMAKWEKKKIFDLEANHCSYFSLKPTFMIRITAFIGSSQNLKKVVWWSGFWFIHFNYMEILYSLFNNLLKLTFIWKFISTLYLFCQTSNFLVKRKLMIYTKINWTDNWHLLFNIPRYIRWITLFSCDRLSIAVER